MNYWLQKREQKQRAIEFYYWNVEFKPVTLDPEVLTPRKGILTRYGKKLLEEGAKFYQKLNINDYMI